MKKIEIKIPDSLTPEEEAIAISKKLMQKALTSVNKNQSLIGEGIIVTDLQTQITITRISKEKVIQMVTCNICGCEYQNNTAVYYWHNYGGSPKKKPTCSASCRDSIIATLGARGANSRKKLIPIRFY